VPALLSSLVDARRDELSAVLSADGRCRPCLRGWLARVPDPRSPLGRWHSLEFVFGLAVCAFTSAGHDSPSTIADWAAGRCQETLAVLGGRRDPWTGKVRPPCERAPSAGSSPGSARRPDCRYSRSGNTRACQLTHGSGHRRRVVFAGRRRAVAPVLQQPRRLLSVTGSTLAWAQRAAASSGAAPGVSLLAARLMGELVSARGAAGGRLPVGACPGRAGRASHGWVGG